MFTYMYMYKYQNITIHVFFFRNYKGKKHLGKNIASFD